MHRVNTSEKWPVKIWASILEPAAEAQALNLAKLPFIHKHVALMPDAHAGKGSTVGAVIATKGAIMPSCVGVDIGCFTPETKVPLTDGTMATLSELSKRRDPFYVYSVNAETKAVVAGLARCIKTRKRAELCEVTISGGEVITCTPDHKFMLRSGEYQDAASLKRGQSLMPLYRRYQQRDGYESIFNPGEKRFRMTHRQMFVASGRDLPDGYVVHHVDHNHLNNDPANLVAMEASAHSAYHREHRSHFRHPDFQSQKMSTVRARGYMFRPQFAEARKQQAVVNITRYMQMQPDHFAASVAGNGDRGKAYLQKYNQSDVGRAKSKELANKLYPCTVCGLPVKSYIGLHNHMRATHNNHKVLSVKMLTRRADVYCLQVETHHNFALAAGVFVHNCGMKAVNLRMPLDAFGGTAKLRALRDDIEQHVPVGQASRGQPLPKTAPIYAAAQARGWEERVCRRLAAQCGTLGGGNHFIELCGDETGNAWVVLHSGSRYVGKWLADRHIQAAKDLMKSYFIDLPDPDLAYLAEQTPAFDSYISDMQWAQNYAWANRDAMMEQVLARAPGR